MLAIVPEVRRRLLARAPPVVGTMVEGGPRSLRCGGRGDVWLTVNSNSPSNNPRAGQMQHMTYHNYLIINTEQSCGLGSLEYIFLYYTND